MATLIDIINKSYNGTNTASIDFHGEKPSAEVRNFMKANNWIWNSNAKPPVWQPNIRNEKAVNESYNFISQFAERFADKYQFSDESKRTIKSFAPDVYAEDPQIEFAQELAGQAINDKPELDNRDNLISELQRQILELQKELKSLKADKTQKYQTPELNIYHTLKEKDIKNLEVVTDEDFSDIVDSIILNDYQHIPNAIRLPNLNEELSEKLGLEKNSAFILKKNATHIRPDRKGSYDQALRVEEYREIPKVMREATFVLIDKRIKNFQIIFDDKENISKINKLVFNKDELGNYVVTIGKVDRRDGISENYNMVVGVGVAPTISALRFPEELPATRLRPSPTTHDKNITQNNYLSNENKENEPLIINTKSLLNNIDEMKQQNKEKTFAEQVDEVIAGTYDRHNAIKICDTPQILIDVGCEQLPILYTQNHLKDALHPKSKLNSHWHGLSIEQIKSIPGLLQTPAILMDSLNNDGSIIAVLPMTDKDNAPIFATIKPNGYGVYESKIVDSNYMLSIYGKDKGFENYIKKIIEQNKLLYWNYEKSQVIQCAELLMAQGLNKLDSDKILKQSSMFVNENLDENLDNNNEELNLEERFIPVKKQEIIEFGINDDIAREEVHDAERAFIDANTVFEGLESNEEKKLTVNPDELAIIKNVLPVDQYVTTLQLSHGEEGEHFKKKIKDIAKAVKNAPKIYQTEEAEEHPIVLRYFQTKGSEILVTEIGENGEAFGYSVLNGNYEWAEWGYIDLHEVIDIPGMEVDYYVPEGMTVERWLYKEKPELYPEYAKFSEEKKIEKTPFDIAQETGNDVEAISAALNKTKTVENDKDYAKGLADWIIQHGLEMSTDQENYHVSFDDILEYTNTPEEWLNDRENIELINAALSGHDDNELLEYNPEENEEREFNLFFCTNSDEMGENTLFKQNKEGRWVRKTEDELAQDKKNIEKENVKNEVSETKPYNFFVKSTAEFDQFADFEPFTGLSAKEAAEKYNSLQKQGISCGIGINIPGDFIFDDSEGNGAIVLSKIENRNSFYMGDNFVKELKTNDEHARNVIAAFSELAENIDEIDSIDFLTSKIKEFNQKDKEIDTISLSAEQWQALDEVQLTSKKDIKAVREQCREILKKADSEITEADKIILAQYEGAGGINEENRTAAGVLNEFYTPNNLVNKVWQIVDAYAPNAKTVLEPSAGVGKFANNRPNNIFTMHELDETSARINKILHPDANIIQGAYQKQFFDEHGISRKTDFVQPKYDVVIGNPPYGKYLDEWKGKGEGKEFDRYEEYFISKGLEALKDENSVMAFVVPSGFLNNANDKQKHLIASKGILVDAYRLPVGAFPTTEVGTDIIIMKNRELCIDETYGERWENLDKEQREDVVYTEWQRISNGRYFDEHPDKVLGEVKTRTNRFGKLEEYVKTHEGLSVQDELNKIDSMLPQILINTKTEQSNSLSENALNYIKNAVDRWDDNNWQIINPNAENDINKLETTWYVNYFVNTSSLPENEKNAVNEISAYVKNNGILMTNFVEKFVIDYLEEKKQSKEINSSNDIPKIYLKETDDIEAAIIKGKYDIPYNLDAREFATAMWYIKDANEQNKSINFYGMVWQDKIDKIASKFNVTKDQIVDTFYKGYVSINKDTYLNDHKSVENNKENTKPEIINAVINTENEAKIMRNFRELDETNYFLKADFAEKHHLDTRNNFFNRLDSYNSRRLASVFDNDISNWRFGVYYNNNTQEAMLAYEDYVIAVIDKNGLLKENFDVTNDGYKSLSKTTKDRLDERIFDFRKIIEQIDFAYLGTKNNASYFRNVHLYNSLKVTIIDDNKEIDVGKSTNIYGAVIGTDMSGNVYDNIDENYKQCDLKPLYASFDSLYPADGKIDLEKILEDNRQITMAVEDEISSLEEPPEPDWRKNEDEYDRMVKARREYDDKIKMLPFNTMLAYSHLSKEEYENKVKAYTLNAVAERDKQIEQFEKEEIAEGNNSLLFETISKKELVPGTSFDYLFRPIEFKAGAEKEDIDVYIDEVKAFTVNETAKKISTYNNYNVPKNYLKFLTDKWDGEISVYDLKDENKEEELSLNKMLEERPISENAKKNAVKVAEFFADRDFSAFEKAENEQYPSKTLVLDKHTYKVVSYGVHRKLFIDDSRYVAADFDIKTNTLSMNNVCFTHSLYKGLEDVYRQMYDQISVKKNFVLDNKNYEDVDGKTKLLPVISKAPYQPKMSHLMDDKEFAKLYGKNWENSDRKYWVATNWKGYVDLSKLSPEDEKALPDSPNYFEESRGQWIHKTLFASGNIYKKLEANEEMFQKGLLSETSYNKNKAVLTAAVPKKIEIKDISVSVKSPFATDLKFNGIPIKELFLQWATGSAYESESGNSRNMIVDFTCAGISREDIPPSIIWQDVVDYCDGNDMSAIRDDTKTKKEKSDIRNQKLNDRKTTAETLFKRFVQTGLTPEQQNIFVDEFNRRFNNNVAPAYETLPLFLSGMNKFRQGKEFKLYDQQIKGISFLCNKGNGLLAYDVGVGKTAAGIAATVEQIQSGRAKRPIIVVPKSVLGKWENDIHELFPEIQVNVLGNLGEKSIGDYYDGNHGLKIPEGSITLVTNEALNNIAFKQETVATSLMEDYADLLALNDKLKDKNDRVRAEATGQILTKAGVSNRVSNEYFVFWENTGFDHITVDEAHRFKNLFKVPRPRKGQSNEFANMGTGEPSKRALKMYNITQLIQKNNEGRNVFMLTATPFTNSPLEVYSMLSYIARPELEAQNIKDLYNFCEEYSSTRLELVVTPSNDVKLSTVMKEFNNLNGLQNILKQFIDKVDGEEADIVRPDKVINPVIIEPTDVQKEIFDFAANEVINYKPKDESEKCAPVLQAMNILRIASLSPALLTEKHLTPFMDPEVTCTAVIPPIEEVVDCSPKLKLVCDSIVKVWKENKTCGQVLYMPEGTEAYPHIINYMVRQGVPREVFATIEGTDATIGGKKVKGSDAREEIAQKFNDAKNPCKILIGSSAISEGMDLNGNSIALYNTMLGWNPSETTQVEGRIWRQGNQQGRVHIVYPLVKGSIDSFLYQKHDEKKSRVDDLFSYKGSTLNVEEINPEEMKWQLIKDPYKRAELELNETRVKLNREKLMLDNQLKDYDSLIENRKLYSDKLEKRKLEKQEYENNYQKDLFEGIQRRSEEEQQTGVARYDLSISKLEGQLETINKKLTAMDIKTDQDEINFSTKILEKQKALENKIEELESPENKAEVAGKYKKIIEQEKIENLEKMLTEPLNEVIVKDKIPAHVNEYNVRESRYKAVIENVKSTPEAIEAATVKWNKFKKEYDEKYNNVKPKDQPQKVVEEKPVEVKENSVKAAETTSKSEKTIVSNIGKKAAKEQLLLFDFDDFDKQPGPKVEVQKIDGKTLIVSNAKDRKYPSVLTHDFIAKNNFYPPFVKNGSNYIIRCNAKDVVMFNGGLSSNPIDIELTKDQFAQMIVYHKEEEKLRRTEEANKNNKSPAPLTPAVVFTDTVHAAKVTEAQKQLILESAPSLSEKGIQDKWTSMVSELSEQVKKIEQSAKMQQHNFENNNEQKQPEKDIGYDLF